MAMITILTIGDQNQFSAHIRAFSQFGAKTDVIGSTDVKDSFVKIQNNHIDVILASFNLGSLNGIDYIKRLKKEILQNPITIFNCDQDERVIKEALKAGIDYVYSLLEDQELEAQYLGIFIKQIIKLKQTEEALNYSDTNFRTIVEATEDSIYMVDRHFRYLFINTPHQRRLDIVGEEYESKQYRDLHSDDENKKFINSMNEVLVHNSFYIDEYEKDGRHYCRKFIPIKYQSSAQVLAATVVSTDVTDRIKLEEAVERGASLISATMETTSDGLFVVDRSGKIINYNQKFLEMWFIPETIIEERDEEVVLAYIEDQLEDRENFIEKYNLILANPDKDSFDVLEFRDGRVFERFTQPQRIGGTVIGRVWSFRDVTSQKSTENVLQVTQANYHSIVESTGDSIFMVDQDCCYLYMNSFHMKKVGDIAEQYQEQRMRVLLTPAEDKRFVEIIKRIFLTKKASVDETTWFGRDYIRHFTPVIDSDSDQVRAITVVLTDITDRKLIEKEIRNSEERLKILFEYAPEAYLLTDIKGTFIESNRAATGLTGYTPDDLKGRNIFTMGMIGSAHITRTAVLFAKNALGKPTGPEEVVITCKDGSQVFSEVMTYPIKIGEQSLVMTIARDITERKKSEESLKKREESYRTLVNYANEGIFVLHDYKITFANQHGADILSLPAEKCQGLDIIPLIHHADGERIAGLIDQAKSGTGIQAGSVIRMINAEGDIRKLEVALVNLDWQAVPSVLMLCNDITDRLLAQEALVSSNKKLNLLSSITRHDVLNQVTILLAYLDLMEKKNSDKELVPYLEKEIAATKTIQNQITFTKEYQDIGVLAPQWQNLGGMIVSVSGSQQSGLITYPIELNKVEVYADPLLVKVFSNLISNSKMHGENISKIAFKLEYTKPGISYTLFYEDDGCGIPEKEKKKIFGHGYGKNTGFGLFLTREILMITGMEIEETGVEGNGARFEITIPFTAIRQKE